MKISLILLASTAVCYGGSARIFRRLAMMTGFGTSCEDENSPTADSDDIPFPFAVLNALGFFPEIEVVTLDNGDEIPQFIIKPEATFDMKPAPGMKMKPEPGMKMKPEPRDSMKPEPRMKPEPEMMKPEPRQKSNNMMFSQSIPKPNFILQNPIDTEKMELASQDIFLDSNIYEVNDIAGVFPLKFEDMESFAVTQDESELLRAEMDLLSTPVTQMYAEAAYFALADARTQCYTDVAKFCSSSSTTMFTPSIISFSRALSSSHRRVEGNGKILGFEGHGQDQRHSFHDEEKEDGENDRHHDHDHHKERDEKDHDHHHSHDQEDEQEWEMEDFMVDSTVPIGWGASTDSCLYEHWNELSTNCKQSATRVQQLRFDFVDDDRWFGRPHLHFGFLGLLLLSLVCCVPRCRKQKRKIHEMHQFLDAIHANPDLKAIVEASTGKPVPKIPPLPKKGKCVKVLLHLIVTFLLAFSCVHISAMIVRLIIINIAESNDQGELILPSPGIIALVMISVLGTTTLFTIITGKLLMRLCGRSSSSSTSTDSSSLEEPFFPPSASTGTSRSTIITPTNFPYIYNGFQFRGSSAPPAGYVPLKSEEEQPGSYSEQVELGISTTSHSHSHPTASAPNIREQPIIAHFSSPVAII